ncbi:ARPP-2 domain-containing protein [Streptosporangium vulgare]|uniref:ARG and Rhodanese-Phosphatase-superfamily-associated domain-containing protein n=1 Tax=Streptosporangium vulgare TaxID=46190 RepID=A0ABV5TA99_9ACTN
MTDLALTGLSTRPAQAWGGVRLVPLVREEPIEDLRLDARLYDAEFGVVAVDSRTSYLSYIPHGFVASWTSDGTPAAAYGTQLRGPRERDRPPGRMSLRFHRRMARRVDRNRLRFLPLHLALEGYLALHFGGPEIVWEEWSHRAVSRGLSPRVEEAYTGAAVSGLEDALRVFEIHRGQCGVLVYVADALAAAFVVPHPGDYRALHSTLVHDLYGELIYHYAMFGGPVPDFRARIADATVRSLADLRAQARRQRDEWAAFHDQVMAGALLGADYTYQHVYEMGGYRLSRFLPPFERQRENHIGELITDGAGRVAYLKTFRLSENQVRRGHLLTRLAAAGWNVADTAAALGVTEHELGLRVEAAGFGHLLRQDVLDHYRAQARRDRR